MGKGGKRMKRRYLCNFHRLGKAVWDWSHRHPGNIAMESHDELSFEVRMGLMTN